MGIAEDDDLKKVADVTGFLQVMIEVRYINGVISWDVRSGARGHEFSLNEKRVRELSELARIELLTFLPGAPRVA